MSFTPMHYFLMGISALVFGSFIGGLVYLVIREKYKGTQAKKEEWRNLLLRRRKAISGRPRQPAQSLSEESTQEWQMTSPGNSPRIVSETKSLDTDLSVTPVSS